MDPTHRESNGMSWVQKPVLEQGEEGEERMTHPLKGIPLSEEHRKKIAEKLKGNKNGVGSRGNVGKKWTDEQKQNLSKIKKGIPHTPEWNKKLSEANKGKHAGYHHTPEALAKISEASKRQIRKPISLEQRIKISESLKGRPGRKHTQEAKDKISKGLTGKKLSPEHCEKISNVQKGRVKSLESKIRLSCSLRGIPREAFDKFASYEDYCIKFNHPFKERVREFFGRVCVQCGKTEEENHRYLGVHHVNYKKDSCCNENTKRLFVALCISCHAKTHYNRPYWEEYFTKMINEKYGGECYLPKS
jgi:hypothetical protein